MSRALQIVEEMRRKSSSTAEDNRRAMPTVTAVVDEFRAAFGQGVKVTYASEGGRTVGTPGERGVVPLIYPKATER